jgi:DNA-binding protein HU-beta
MTKAELIERVYKNRGLPPALTKKSVGQIVEAIFGEIGEYFIRAKVPNNSRGKPKRPYPKFTFPGFGTFTKKKRAERRGVEPRTKSPIVIPAAVTITFQPGQELKSVMNNK